jgi:hypothetical protein
MLWHYRAALPLQYSILLLHVVAVRTTSWADLVPAFLTQTRACNGNKLFRVPLLSWRP